MSERGRSGGGQAAITGLARSQRYTSHRKSLLSAPGLSMRKSYSARRAAAHVLVVVVMATLGGSACDDAPPGAPTPPGSGQPTPGAGSGLVQITYQSAAPPPGSTIAGCGPQIAGCAGRIHMRFRLIPAATGDALFTRAWLFDSVSRRACLWAEGGPMPLRAGAGMDIEVSFDHADECGVPLEINNMAFVIEGTVQVASRQEWGVRYAFAR